MKKKLSWIFVLVLMLVLATGSLVLADGGSDFQASGETNVIAEGPSFAPEDVLFEQPADTTSGSAAQAFPDFGGALLINSDDFVVPSPGWNIESIYYTFFWSPNNANPPIGSDEFTGNVVYTICEDDGGQPACLANGDGSALVDPLWTVSVDPTDPAMSWVEGGGAYEVTADMTAVTGDPNGVSVGPGTYWMVIYLEHDFGAAGIGGQVFWYTSTQENGVTEARFMDPANLIPSLPCPTWCDTNPDASTNMAFTLEGTTFAPTDVSLTGLGGESAGSMPWLPLLAGVLAIAAAGAFVMRRRVTE